jgi:hypothetical protein
MDSFFCYNLDGEPLGSFHPHPRGNFKPSTKNKLNRFDPGQLRFLIYLKEKPHIKDERGPGRGLQITAVTTNMST